MRARWLMLAVALGGCSLIVPGPDDYEFVSPHDGGAPSEDAGAMDGGDFGADAGEPEPDGGPDAGCVAGEMLCGGACVDTQADPANCGGCGTVCDEGWICRSGDCSDPVVDLDCGPSHTCVIRGSGSVWCWGRNESGQLGAGDFENSSSPVRVSVVDDARQLAASGSFFGGTPGSTCVARASGEVWCWGNNFMGKLGDGTTEPRNVPVRAEMITAAVSVGSGVRSSCVSVSASPFLLCWGAPVAATEPREAPFSVIGLPTTSSRYPGFEMSSTHACILDDAGGVWCWGSNAVGQLGDGTTDERPVAAQVSGLPPVVEISVGTGATCAREAMGQVWCWGAANLIGIDETSMDPVSAPVALTEMTDAVRLFAGAVSLTTCAERPGGEVWCWGDDPSETVRTGSVSYWPVPTRLTGVAAPEDMAMGLSLLCVLDADGGVRCLGDNEFGQLGDGTTEDRESFVSVEGL